MYRKHRNKNIERIKMSKKLEDIVGRQYIVHCVMRLLKEEEER